VLPGMQSISHSDNRTLKWSTLVEEKRELWPIAYLLPNGAYIH